jgi:hypothetical protein
VYLHCTDPRCGGILQEEVDGYAEETAWMFTENGGDIPGVERSHVHARVANAEDVPCPYCDVPREASLKPRPQYQRLSGHDPNGLLKFRGFDPAKPVLQAGADPAELDALKQQIAELRDLVAKKAA